MERRDQSRAIPTEQRKPNRALGIEVNEHRGAQHEAILSTDLNTLLSHGRAQAITPENFPDVDPDKLVEIKVAALMNRAGFLDHMSVAAKDEVVSTWFSVRATIAMRKARAIVDANPNLPEETQKENGTSTTERPDGTGQYL